MAWQSQSSTIWLNFGQIFTVDGRGKTSKPNEVGTSKLDCGHFESMQINWNTIQICTNSQHGLRTPNDSINQRYLKNWADSADKICCRHT